MTLAALPKTPKPLRPRAFFADAPGHVRSRAVAALARRTVTWGHTPTWRLP